jgi:hypothetical protein
VVFASSDAAVKAAAAHVQGKLEGVPRGTRFSGLREACRQPQVQAQLLVLVAPSMAEVGAGHVKYDTNGLKPWCAVEYDPPWIDRWVEQGLKQCRFQQVGTCAANQSPVLLATPCTFCFTARPTTLHPLLVLAPYAAHNALHCA